MDCRELHDSIRRGERPEGMAAHLATCAPCRSLVEGGMAVGRALARAEDDAGAELDAVFAGIDTAERGPRAWLRARPSRVRSLLGWLAAALVPALVFVAAPRADLAGRVLLGASLLAALLVVLVGRALRPLDRPDRLAPLDLALPAAAGLVALLVALLPPGHPGPAIQLGRSVAICLGVGVVAGLPTAAALLLLDRLGSRRVWGHALLGAAVAGNLALQLHCPIVDRTHLLLGHAMLIPVAVLALQVAWPARRSARRS